MGLEFRELFDVGKPIIGMIHLAGKTHNERVERALEELNIYDQERIDGAIIENFHGGFGDLSETLMKSNRYKFNLVRGVNFLRDPYDSFRLAHMSGAKFVQFDNIQTNGLKFKLYHEERKTYPNIAVLGGVGFKYTHPTGNPLRVDLEEAMPRCEAIVTTGSGTGVETPIEKLRKFRLHMGRFPLIVGAGVNAENFREQLKICDGAIVGSYCKPNGDTQEMVDRNRVRSLRDAVRLIR